MYLIDIGKVRISVTDTEGQTVNLADLGPGDFFGEMAMLDGKGRPGAATAVEDARLAKLTREDFLQFMRDDPRVPLELLNSLTAGLRRTDELLRHRVSRNVNQEEEARLTFADRAADRIAEFGGSWKFIIFSISLFAAWGVTNSVLLAGRPFRFFPFS